MAVAVALAVGLVVLLTIGHQVIEGEAVVAGHKVDAVIGLAVFVAVPLYGIAERGAAAYLRRYLQPTWLMLPFNVIGELSRTLALAVRLYGNIMSGTVIVALLVGLAPLVFPLVMQLLGLVTGLVQAYIFAVLAMVYIASATSAISGQGPEPDAEDPSP